MARQLQTGAKVRTDEVANAIRALLWEELGDDLALKTCRVGGIEHALLGARLADLLPAIFVRPIEATFAPESVHAMAYEVSERFRIAYAVPIGAQDEPGVVARAGLGRIVAELAADAGLSSIADGFAPDQIIEGFPEGVEYDPPEDAFLELDLPIKVAVCRWVVRWRSC